MTRGSPRVTTALLNARTRALKHQLRLAVVVPHLQQVVEAGARHRRQQAEVRRVAAVAQREAVAAVAQREAVAAVAARER